MKYLTSLEQCVMFYLELTSRSYFHPLLELTSITHCHLYTDPDGPVAAVKLFLL